MAKLALAQVVILLILSLIFLCNPQKSLATSLEGYADANTYFWDSGEQPYIGDISGDGNDDLLIFTNDNSGTMYVYLNGNIPTGNIVPSTDTNYNVKYTNIGLTPFAHPFAVGDINSDGKNDVVFGETALFGIPSTFIDDYANQTNQSINISTTPTSYLFKIYLAANSWRSDDSERTFIKDVSGDGKNDLVTYTNNLSNVYYINNDILVAASSGTQLNLAEGSSYSVKLTVTSILETGPGLVVGDISGDGKADLVIRRSGSNGTISFLLGSQLAAISGTGNTLDVTNVANLTKRIAGTATVNFSDTSTASMATVDLTGDGKLDLAIGTGNSRDTNLGDVFVFKNELIASWEGTTGVSALISDQTQFTYSVGGTGTSFLFSSENSIYATDLNQNGKNELIIGDYYNNYGCTDCGSVYVISDALLDTFAVAVSPSNIFTLTNSNYYTVRVKGTDNYHLGNAQGWGTGLRVGDFNTDGYDDLIIGTHNQKAYLYLSSRFAALGSTTGNIWTISDTSSYDRDFTDVYCNGCTLQIGDITGDGANDFVMGAGDVFVFNGGSLINSLNVALTAELASNASNPLVVPQGGTKNIVLKKSSTPIALISTSFANIDGLDWSDITADVDTDLGKAVVTNIDLASGTANTHSLYVKKLTDSTGVYVCPDATSILNITDSCTNGYLLSEGDSNLSSVAISSVDYWKIDGLTGTGAQNDFTVAVVANNNSSTSTSTSTNNTSGTYSCNDTQPVSAPDLFQINTSSDSAKLFFTPINNTNTFYISYSTKAIAEEYSAEITLSKEGVQTFTINFLKPSTTYYFKVRGQNGCMPGNWSNTMKVVTQTKRAAKPLSFYKNSANLNKKVVKPNKTEQVQQSIPDVNQPANGVAPGADTSPILNQNKSDTNLPIKTSKTCFLWWCW